MDSTELLLLGRRDGAPDGPSLGGALGPSSLPDEGAALGTTPVGPELGDRLGIELGELLGVVVGRFVGRKNCCGAMLRSVPSLIVGAALGYAVSGWTTSLGWTLVNGARREGLRLRYVDGLPDIGSSGFGVGLSLGSVDAVL